MDEFVVFYLFIFFNELIERWMNERMNAILGIFPHLFIQGHSLEGPRPL